MNPCEHGNNAKIFMNVSWALLGKVINILNGILVGVLVARYLGPESYGVMSYVVSYVTLFSVISNFGLDPIEVKELARNEGIINEILGTAVLLRMGFGILAIILVCLTSLALHTEGHIFLLIIIYSTSLFFSSANVIRNYFTSIIQNKYVVKTEVARNIVGAVIKLFLVWIEAPLFFFIIAITFDFILVALGYLHAFSSTRTSITKWKFSGKLAIHLISESFPFLLSGAIIIIYQKIDQVLINHFLDAKQLGIFAVASRLLEVGLFLPTIVAKTVTPILVRKHRDDFIGYIKLRQQFVDLVMWGGGGGAVVMCILSPLAIKLLFGQDYLDAIPVLRILSWKILFVAAWSSSGQIIVVEGIQRWAMVRNLIGCVCCVLLNIWFIPLWGITGSAVATLFTMACSGIFAHLVIPSYRFLFVIQIRALGMGWLSLYSYVKQQGLTLFSGK